MWTSIETSFTYKLDFDSLAEIVSVKNQVLKSRKLASQIFLNGF
jgi:hypothetical protein